MKYHILAAMLACFAVVACSDSSPPDGGDDKESDAVTLAGTNALLAQWDTPYGVPPFDRISSEDYLPALRHGMSEERQEIDAIIANTNSPSFENTIEAFERSGSTLDRVTNAFFALNSAHTDDTLRETATTIAPELSAHNDDISLDSDLFERVNAVYEQRDKLQLGREQRRLLDETYKQFIRSGANLEPVKQQQLREINAELATLSQQFQENLLDETNNFELLVTDRADLAGYDDGLISPWIAMRPGPARLSLRSRARSWRFPRSEDCITDTRALPDVACLSGVQVLASGTVALT